MGNVVAENIITMEEFEKVEFRIGTIIEAKVNAKARKPAYALKIDMGEELGIKTSSAQIVDLYKPEDLIGRQVICCVNLSPMHIASVKSEVRVMGTESKQGVVLLAVAEKVENGDRVY